MHTADTSTAVMLSNLYASVVQILGIPATMALPSLLLFRFSRASNSRSVYFHRLNITYFARLNIALAGVIALYKFITFITSGPPASSHKPSTPAPRATPTPSASGSPAASPHTVADASSFPWAWVIAAGVILIALGLTALMLVSARSRAHELAAKRAEAAAERERLRHHQQEQEAVLASIVERGEHVSKRWMEYQTNLQAILARPLLQDLSDERVQRVVKAMLRARDTKPASGLTFTANEYAADTHYASAVSEFEAALDAAEAAADKVKDAQFHKGERRRLQEARQILAMALDESNAAARGTYYKRVLSLVDGLITVPEQARLQIETRLGLKQITGSTVLGEQ